MTPQVIDDLCADYGPRLKTRRHKANYGVSASRNHGARLTSGEYICYLDADDFAPPYRAEQVGYELRGGTDMVYGQKEYFEGESWAKRTRKHPAVDPTAQNYLGCGCGGSAVSVRRSLHLDMGVWWDEHMMVAEDAEFLIACLAAEAKVLCSPNVYSWMRLSKDSLTHRGDWATMREYISEKHQTFLSSFFGTP
jgi:glycosyltransferase involved in cell wall biosynthesis